MDRVVVIASGASLAPQAMACNVQGRLKA
ncbi:MAG: hypothetical protein RIT28_4799, partial [Pseudomonadota bacterium]